MFLDKCSSFFFRITTDFTHHHDRLSRIIILKHGENIDEITSWNGITTNTYTGTLSKPEIRCLLNSFVSQRA